MRPQAAIVNVYSPGDSISLHRDVSEGKEAGLVSISLGCETTEMQSFDLFQRNRRIVKESHDIDYLHAKVGVGMATAGMVQVAQKV